MSNPVVIEVLRGDRVESAHRGAGAVVDADGRIAFAFGDVDRPIYPRSAVKALQALPLIESGAADRLGLTEAEIALACASHAGEDVHVAAAAAMLAKAGRDAGALRCGTHWPGSETAARALARRGATPSALHNNCSGKHAGFVCLACAQGIDPAGYVSPDHAVQRAVTAALADMTGVALGRGNPRDRRLLDSRLRDPAAGAGAWALPASRRGRGCRLSAPGRRRAFAPRSRRTLRWWAARAGSTPRS